MSVKPRLLKKKKEEKKQNICNTLLSFVGLNDPSSSKGGDGPLLTYYKHELELGHYFQRVILFYMPDMFNNACQTKKALLNLTLNATVELYLIDSLDPTSYESILKGIRKYRDRILTNKDYAHQEFYISVASGTPTMHACWLLLAASDEIPAHIRYVRRPEYVREGQPLVAEINPQTKPFPRILQDTTVEEISGMAVDTSEAVKKLGIIVEDEKSRNLLKIIEKAATTDATFLITGENGTGKDLFARLIHELSKRRDKIFFPLTCSAIPSTLLETELFGYVKGAFTGASRDKLGCFDYANGGTLFLNEIGDMPLELQAKLLDVLQDGDIKPVGGCTYHPVNVRIIAATNKDLTALIKDNQFREDLYYRLNVINICIPPLRGRISEVPKLATQFLNKFNDALNKSVFFSQGALQKLQDYNWPGNVRQLNHVIEKTVILATKQEIEAEDIDIVIPPAYPFIIPEPSEDFSLENFVKDLRDQLIKRAMAISGNNQRKAAALLGMSGQNISKHLKKHSNNSG